MQCIQAIGRARNIMTRSEKRALLTNFIVLQETRKHENSDHCMKFFISFYRSTWCKLSVYAGLKLGWHYFHQHSVLLGGKFKVI